MPKKITPQKQEVVLKRLKAQMNAAWTYRQQNYDAHLKDVLDHVYPQAKRFLMGTDKHDRASQSKIVNNVGKTSLNTFAAGMQSGTCSPSRPWFSLGANSVIKSSNNIELTAFLQELQAVVYKELAASNVYQVVHTLFKDQGACGAGCALFDDSPESNDRDKAALELIHYPFGTFAVDVDYLNRVTCLYHWVDMSLNDIVERFPEDSSWPYPEKIKTAIQDNKSEQMFKVAHIIEKSKNDLVIEGKNLVDKPYLSYWFLEGEVNSFLRVSGFDGFPGVVPRMEAMGTDRYGESLASMAIGDFKELQKTHVQMLEGTDRAIRPPMLIPTSMRNNMSQLNPGGRIFYDPQLIAGSAVDTVKPAVQVALDYSGVMNEQNSARERIRQTFYTDLFLMLDNFDKGRMTATEVAERKSEKMLMLGSILERQNVELLEPIIKTAVERVLQMTDRYPELIEKHRAFADQPFDIEFVSILSQAQKAAGSANLERATQYLIGVIQANPESADFVDVDKLITHYCDMNSVPADVLRSIEAVKKIRSDRAEMQKQQAQMQMMMQMGQGAQNLAGAVGAVADLNANPNMESPI